MTDRAVQSDVTTFRERLLDATERVVARDGVTALTLDAVAKEAAVSKGGLLYHFPSKQALVLGMIERFAQQRDCEYASAIASGDPGAFARALVDVRCRPLQHDQVPVHAAILAAVGTNPQYIEPLRERLLHWQARLERDGIDPVTATIVRLAVDGLCIGQLLGLNNLSQDMREQVVERLRQMTLPAKEGTQP
jgi:AcrR family transcriptional regulator